MTLYDFVTKYSARRACCCGLCEDVPPDPAGNQPSGHTVDLTFFKVGLVGEPDADEFRGLARPHMPDQETSYIALGADVGDQGFALQLMGLGHLLGVWRVRSPATEIGFEDDELKRQIAGLGMVTIEPLEVQHEGQ